MQIRIKPAVLALMLAATPLAAQETATEETPATEEAQATEEAPATEAPAEAPAADPADGLSMGEPEVVVPSEPVTGEELARLRPGQFYVLELYQDWKIRCVKTPEDEPDPCQLYQLLVDADGNAVAEMNLFRLPEGSRAVAGANIVVPLETLLTQQLTLTVDGGQARRYPFTFCNVGGCVARVGFTQEEIDLFRRGSGAVLRLVPAGAPDQEVLLNMSLSGFTAAFEGDYIPPQ